MTDTTTAIGSDTTTQKADDPATSTPTPSEGGGEPKQQPTLGDTTPKEGGEPTTTDAPETKPAAQAPQGAPEGYKFTPPEGQTLSKGVVEAFEAKARELNLTQDGAQSMLDSMLPAIQKAGVEQLQTSRIAWREEASNDDEIGGDAFEANMAVANKAVKEFGNKAFVQLLDESGLADHPEMIRFVWNVGRRISEDSILSGSGPTRGGQGSDADFSDPAVQTDRFYKKTE